MRSAAGAGALLTVLLLSGCGNYALAFTPSGSLPPTPEIVGEWRNADGATLTFSDDGSYSFADVPAEVLAEDWENVEGSTDLVSGTGEYSEPTSGPDSMDHLELTPDDGTTMVRAYYYDGLLEDPVFVFSMGVVDDGHWYRFERR